MRMRRLVLVDRLDPQEARYHDPSTGTTPRTGNVAWDRSFDPWRYRDDVALSGADLSGYKVEAVDGSIGKVDQATHEVNAACMVVDTGPWIFGKKVLLPAGTVSHVDHDSRIVYVDRTKEQIKTAPEVDSDRFSEQTYRDKIGGYYGDTYTTMGGTTYPRDDQR
jgi:hypothetical protein